MTFGSPRVGGRRLGRVLRGAGVKMTRWVNGWDIVPTVPWPWVPTRPHMVYRHVCDERLIGEGLHPFEDHKLQAGYRASLVAMS